MRKSVVLAIREGEHTYEPEKVDDKEFDATPAMPGTDEKLSVMEARVRAGLPLWHGLDRMDYDDPQWSDPQWSAPQWDG